ncbi:MAG: flagellar protein FlaG [Lachnospiraceae bacterium]|nr:flagellar protein FlaG [Lachnospiraceae bacterium]
MGIEVIGTQGFQPSVEPIPVSSNTSAQSAAANSVNTVAPVTSKGGSDGSVKNENGEQPSADEIKSAINQANRRAKFGHANAEFSYHEETKRISIKIVDQDTNEVIREIPPEETLDMISKMWELAGIIVDEKR